MGYTYRGEVVARINKAKITCSKAKITCRRVSTKTLFNYRIQRFYTETVMNRTKK